MRVLRIYHSAVVDEYRERERLLRARHGHIVHVVCPPAWREGGRLVSPSAHPDTPVHLVGVRGRRVPNLFWYAPAGLRRVLREVRPQIVDIHEEPYSLAMAGVLRAIGREAPHAKICVYTAQNLLKTYPPPFRWIERRALASAAAAYPCSTEAGERLLAQGFRGSLHVMPLGVTVLPAAPRSPGGTRVGFVGRLEPYKGGMISIRAFAQAANGADASLEVIGAGSEEVALRREAEATGLRDRVVFTGALSQDETLARIGRFDVLLVPSLTTPTWKEQFGRVAAQAMAAGTAVIASDCGSLREVVGDYGRLVPEGDVNAFAAALQTLLREPSRLAALGERGRQHAQKSLSWEYVSDRVDKMYREALEGPIGVA